MRAPATTWTTEQAVLLAAAVVVAVAAAVAGLSAGGALPQDPGYWLVPVALGVAGASAVACWLAHVARRAPSETENDELAVARGLLSAIPDGLVLVQDGRVRSVNRRLCDLLGFERAELVGQEQPFPFWPPEHHHELAGWHARLEREEEVEGELTFRRSNGERLRVVVAGRRVVVAGRGPLQVLTVRDVSTTYRRERRLAELCGRDPQTGLSDHREFETLLAAAVRRGIASGEPLTLVLVEVSVGDHTGAGVFGRPEALVAVERLHELTRVDDILARTGESELAWILPDTDVHGGVGAVARARGALASLPGLTLTVGICDLATAGDALTLCAFADRALVDAREQGPGGTALYRPVRAA